MNTPLKDKSTNQEIEKRFDQDVERFSDLETGQTAAMDASKVLSYIDTEDSPRPITYQLDRLRKVGFTRVDLLHKTACFAAFGAIKAP